MCVFLPSCLHQGRLALPQSQKMNPDWPKTIMVPFPSHSWAGHTGIHDFRGSSLGNNWKEFPQSEKRGTRERPSIISYNHLAIRKWASLKIVNTLRGLVERWKEPRSSVMLSHWINQFWSHHTRALLRKIITSPFFLLLTIMKWIFCYSHHLSVGRTSY